jgi:uncharacterized protein (DUF952 family)
MRTIICITTKSLWEEALQSGEYKNSTITSSLEEVGFIHATMPDQTMAVIPRFTGTKDVILLFIDADKVKVPLKFEPARSGRAGLFPHIYGPLNVDAVYETAAVEKNSIGDFVAPGGLLNLLD